MFHRVVPQRLIQKPDAYYSFGTLISQEYFENLLQFIVENGFQFVTISELKNLIGSNRNLDNVIALTFDDGYHDNFEYVFPVLMKFKAKATFFPVVTPCKENSVLPLDIYYQHVDNLNLTEDQRAEFLVGKIKKGFYWAEPSQQSLLLEQLFHCHIDNPRVSFMSASELRILSDHGFEIGSHGMTHSLMTADYMNEQKMHLELTESKNWIEKVVGKPVISYCFPAGRYNSHAIDIAKSIGYTSACLVKKTETESESLPCFERVFVTPDSFDKVKTMLTNV